MVGGPVVPHQSGRHDYLKEEGMIRRQSFRGQDKHG
jgi:hypothetical protein